MSGSTTKSTTFTDPAILANFLPSYSATASDTSSVVTSFSGGIVAAGTTSNTGTLSASVTYTYDLVPAPGSLALFGTGLLALAGVRRHSKRSRA